MTVNFMNTNERRVYDWTRNFLASCVDVGTKVTSLQYGGLKVGTICWWSLTYTNQRGIIPALAVWTKPYSHHPRYCWPLLLPGHKVVPCSAHWHKGPWSHPWHSPIHGIVPLHQCWGLPVERRRVTWILSSQPCSPPLSGWILCLQ